MVNDARQKQREAGQGAAERRRGAPHLGRLLPWKAAGRTRYDAAFDTALGRALELHGRLQDDKAAAQERRRRLLRQPMPRRRLMVRNHAHYAGWWLAWLLLDEAEGHLAESPAEAERLAGLALEALFNETTCDETACDETACEENEAEPLSEDLRARGWRLAADAHRRLGDLARAASCLARALRHRRRGTGEPLERALLIEARGRLLADQGRRRRGASLLRQAARQFRRLRDAHLEGRARAALGLLLAEDAAVQAGAELKRARHLLDAAREPVLARAVERRWADLALPGDLYPAAAVYAGAGLAPVAGPTLSPPT